MFWGSFRGIYATELTDNGLEIKKKHGWNPSPEEAYLWKLVLKGTNILQTWRILLLVCFHRILVVMEQPVHIKLW